MTLFHEQVIVCPLGSGSRGNTTYVGDGRRGVLVDCGLSTAQIFKRLAAVGLGDTRIDAVLVTHEHADHVGAARILDTRLEERQGTPVPFFLTEGTRRALDSRVAPRSPVRVTPGTAFTLPGVRIEPYGVPHDTAEPVAYAIEMGRVRVGVITDLGRPTRLVERMLASFDVALLEFNHDPEMLMNGSYPWALKQRVRGPHGHLSNRQAADLLVAAASGRLKHLCAAHLSEENNRPELALEAAAEALSKAGARHVRVSVASQQMPLDPVAVSGPLTGAKRDRPTRPRPSAPTEPQGQMPLFPVS